MTVLGLKDNKSRPVVSAVIAPFEIAMSTIMKSKSAWSLACNTIA